jgi:hypothetical protein
MQVKSQSQSKSQNQRPRPVAAPAPGLTRLPAGLRVQTRVKAGPCDTFC